MEKIVIGGAAFIYGLGELKEAFEGLGHQVSFVEAPFMNDYTAIEEKNLVTFTSDIEDGVLVPVSEYWITKAIDNGLAKISRRALKASRSKVFLSSVLKEKGIECIEPLDYEDAVRKIKEGKKVIVKPEGLYSGYGIRIVQDQQKLDEALEKCRSVKTHSLKLFGVDNKTPVIWEVLEGTEFSADCFWYKGVFVPVRLCRKRVASIHENPCTLAVQMMPFENRIIESLNTWTKALFDSDDISFAQFDFIDDGKNLIPVDFASRVGGGMADLLKMDGNPYAKAVRSVKCGEITEDYGKNWPLGLYPTQFNYLPVRSGKIKNLDFVKLTQNTVTLKKKGDFVPESPSSVASRIAVGTGFYGDIMEVGAETLDHLLLGDEVIGDWKTVK